MKKIIFILFILMCSIIHGQTTPPMVSVVCNNETYTSNHPYNLNIVYFLPKDQAVDPTYQTRLSAIMLYYQNWIRTQMINSGYGDRTFGLLTSQSGSTPPKVLINFIQGKEPVTSYPYSGGAGKVNKEIDDYFKANPLLKKSDHTLIIIPTLDIKTVNLPFFGQNKSAFTIDYPQYQVSNFGTANDWSGGNLHEFGHALNLDHSHQTVLEESNSQKGTNIMSNNHGTFGVSPTFINRAGCAVLNTNQLFSTTEGTFYNGNVSKITRLNASYNNGALVVSGTFQSSQPVTDVNIYQDPSDKDDSSQGYEKVAWSVSPTGNSFTVTMPTNELFNRTRTYNLQVELVLGNGQVARYSYPYSYNNGVPTININFDNLSFASTTTCSGQLPFTGTVIGSTGSWGGGTNTRDRVFDGNTSTYFDGASANGQWAGLDLGSNENITCIKFTPRNGDGGNSRMIGGKFQISSDAAFTNPITIYTITTQPTFQDYYITSNLPEGVSARYIRYLSPDGGFGNIAEVTVYGPSFVNSTSAIPNSLPHTGTVIGTTGSYDGTNTRDKVFDGNTNTFFDGASANGQWVGLDLESNMTITTIIFRPRKGNEDRIVGGKFQISTDAAFTNPTTIYTMAIAPSFKDFYITSRIPEGISARYIRYLSPDGGQGNIAEITVAGRNQYFVSNGSCVGESIQATGTVIGTTGSSGGSSNTRDKVFDGNTSTFFDGSTGNAQWAGLDLGSNKYIKCIKFRPRNGNENRMVGGKFQISSDAAFTNPTTIYTINTLSTFTDYYITSRNQEQGVSARYIRYLSPDGGFGNIAEVTVYINPSSARLTANDLNSDIIKEIEISPEVTVFPNPVENTLHVNIVTKNKGDLQIYNMQGQRIYHKSDVENSLQIQVGNWAEGIYILRFKDKTVKFIKR